jgi:tetratricopeptide (TPR) repeat protein
MSLDVLTAICIMQEQYAKAEPLLEEALEIQRKTLGPHHRITAVSMYNLAGIYYGMGDSAKAESLLEQVRQMWLNGFGPEHPFMLRNLNDLALIKIELGKLEEAKRLARLKASVESVLVAKIFAFASEQQRLSFLNEFDPYHLFAQLKGCESELAAADLHYKGVVLDSVIEDRRIAEASRESGNRKLVRDLDATKQQLGKLLLQSPQQDPLETKNRIRELEEAADQKENELATYVEGLGLGKTCSGRDGGTNTVSDPERWCACRIRALRA